MANRKKTRHRGIYRIGKNYYVTYSDGTKKTMKNGEEYSVRQEKKVGTDLKKALKFKVDMEEQVRKGKHGISERAEKTTFGELMALYKKERDAKKYVLQFEEAYLESFKDRKLSTITRSDLFSFRDKIKATPKKRGGSERKDSSVNRALAGLRRLLNFALDRQVMEDTPFPKISKSGLVSPEPKGLRNFFTEAQMTQIIETADPILRPIILTAYLTGMRLGELRGLKWEHINLDDGIIYLPRSKTLNDETGLGQKIVMQRELVDLFKKLPNRSEWVFFKWDGGPLDPWDIYKPFKKLLELLGIDKKYSWKELRHTTGSIMHKRGVPLLSIKDHLRHTESRTTEQFYIGQDDDHQREQSEKLVFKELPIS